MNSTKKNRNSSHSLQVVKLVDLTLIIIILASMSDGLEQPMTVLLCKLVLRLKLTLS